MISESSSIPSSRQRGAPLIKTKGRFLRAKRGYKKKGRNVLARNALFRKGCAPKQRGRDLSENFLVLARIFHVDWLKVAFLGG